MHVTKICEIYLFVEVKCCYDYLSLPKLARDQKALLLLLLLLKLVVALSWIVFAWVNNLHLSKELMFFCKLPGCQKQHSK
uniref:Uncharacterized protein n=1 Tax=Arundo donax TaxID=35708 RepID=A0A0A9AZ89_ARUDO